METPAVLFLSVRMMTALICRKLLTLWKGCLRPGSILIVVTAPKPTSESHQQTIQERRMGLVPNGQNTLYWHWSPNYGWDTYQQVSGWNEALITYVMAASSPKHTIDSLTYANGWARNGAMINGNVYYSVPLPLGPSNGGPLFFEHYSFMGINPNGLTDAFANYQQQTLAHTQINYNYCVANPKRYNGYSDSCWGLTASDDNLYTYSAHEPNNDDGVLTPTAALSSFPYTPDQSMAALQFFYYKLGDKLWNSYYGFRDAFNLTEPWFDNDFLAIDQMPIVVMVENYRSSLVWNLFMSCP
jgi:hypothetical protein